MNTAPMDIRRSGVLAAGVVLMWLFWASRIIGINAFPPFIDEAFHISFGAHVLQTGPLAHADEGRQLTIWWYMLFQAQSGAPIFVARIATLLAGMVGTSALLGIGRQMAGGCGLALCALASTLSTYHLFFGRLALADPVSAAGVFVGIYFALRLSRRVNQWDAALTGLALFAAVGAKISAVPYLSIPIIAVISLRSRNSSRMATLRWVLTALIIGGGLTILFLAVIIGRGYNPFFYLAPESVLQDETLAIGTILDRIPSNILTFSSLAKDYFGLGLAGALLVATAALGMKRRLYLPLALILPMLVLWMSQRQASRHLMVPVSLLVVCGAVALATATRRRPIRLKVAIIGVLLGWGGLNWLPFAWGAAQASPDLPLAASDRLEYITSDASGFGLARVRESLLEHSPREVIGVLANCLSLRYLMFDQLMVACPRLNPNGEDIDNLTQLLADSRADGVYVVLEDSPYAPDSAPGRLLSIIARPDGGPGLAIYSLAP